MPNELDNKMNGGAIRQIYLDNNATTPLDPRVLARMSEAYREFPANPSSQHQAGRAARSHIDAAAESVLAAIGATTGGMREDRVIWTSGGTEANNLAIRGLLPRNGHLIYAEIEHPSVTAVAEQLQREGYRTSRLRVHPSGTISLDHLEEVLAAESARSAETSGSTTLVAVMAANNETGVAQPVGEVSQLCHRYGALFHSDIVQVIGKSEFHFGNYGATTVTLAPHKFHGPRGIGALVVRHGTVLTPLMYGGAQQFGSRPGTECTALIAGMTLALRLAQQEWSARAATMRHLRDTLERRIREEIAEVVVIGEDAERLPHTSCLAFPGVDRQALMMALDFRGVACSTGSACASGSSEPSPVLRAMGLPPRIVDGAIRLSIGQQNTESEVEQAARLIAVAATTK